MYKIYKITDTIYGADGDWGTFSIDSTAYKVDRVYIHHPGYHRIKGKQYDAEIHFQGFNGGKSATYVVFMQRDDLADDNPFFTQFGWEGLESEGFHKELANGPHISEARASVEKVIIPGKKFLSYKGMMLEGKCGDTQYVFQMAPSYFSGFQADAISKK
jgi:carbonic anhydrase